MEEGIRVDVAGSHVTTTSHGDEALLLLSGREAADLAYLASTTSLLVKAATRQKDISQLAGLVERSKDLVQALAEIHAGSEKEEKDLPYKQLVPVQVWKETTKQQPELARLIEVIPKVLASITEGNGSISDLKEAAKLLDMASAGLQDHTTRILKRVSTTPAPGEGGP